MLPFCSRSVLRNRLPTVLGRACCGCCGRSGCGQHCGPNALLLHLLEAGNVPLLLVGRNLRPRRSRLELHRWGGCVDRPRFTPAPSGTLPLPRLGMSLEMPGPTRRAPS
eukprot:SM000008S22187  [mRNA]  locus=s8:323556:324236:+ [translate_table: standard]